MRTLHGLILLLVACGDPDPQTTAQATDTGKTDTGDDATASSGSPTTTTTATTGASEGATTTGPVEPTGGESTDTDASTSDASSSTTTSSTTAPSTGEATGTTGEAALLALSLEDVQIYANCQPFVPADMIIGQWTVVFDNTLGEADMATLTGVTFMTIEGDPPVGVPWEASPTTSGPLAAGAKLSQPVKKIKGMPFPGCSTCGKPVRLRVNYDLAGGAKIFAQADFNLDCVY